MRGLERLNALRDEYIALPVTIITLRSAADLWAQARRGDKPTASPDALDIDVILAAQSRLLSDLGAEVIIATTNPGH